MRPLRFATLGTGFWARFQLSAWKEVGGAECVALYNRTRSKAEALGREMGIHTVYDDPGHLLRKEKLDFVDIITDPGTHERFVTLAAGRVPAVICQKPLAENLASAERMMEACRTSGTALYVHENFRWQTPIRAFKAVLDEGRVGTVFRARIEMVSGFDVFANQPFLRTLEQFVLNDVGTHVLDVARFLFGEVESLVCHTRQIHTDIAGEDVATVLLRTRRGASVVVTLGYAGTPLERERFPETFVFAEGEWGSVELGPDYWLRTTTAEGTHARRVPPPRYAWADPRYDVVHASGVPCNANLLAALRGEGEAETTAADNYETLRLVFAAYASAESGAVVPISERI
jgi:predicted dehydrogenase